MSQYNTSGVRSFYADVAITVHQRVKLSATGVAIAGADEAAVGFAQSDAAIGEQVAVRLINSQGTFKAIAGEAVSVNGVLYGLASGKVGDTDGGAYTARYKALEAASGDGSIIEIIPTTLA